MQLKKWRKDNRFTLAQLGVSLGFGPANPARPVQMLERGAVKCDADNIERIIAITNGDVTLCDMHQTRLDWLKANKPELFECEAGA